MNEMSEYFRSTRKKNRNIHRRRTSLDSKPQRRFLVPIGIAVVILISFFALISSTRNKVSKEDLNSINNRLDQLEKRLTQVEGQVKGFQQSMAKIDKSGRSITQQLNKVTNKIDLLQKRIASIAVQTKSPSDEQKKPTSQAKRRYHEVRPGDSLYRIAKQYGTSVNELRSLNNFAKDQDIYPGQRILVPSNN